MPQEKRKPQVCLLENLSAISAEFHASKHYENFYNNNCDQLGGFVGIWGYMIKAAEAFTAVEFEMVDAWVDGWIEALTGFTEGLFDAGEVLQEDGLKSVARKYIGECCAEEGLFRSQQGIDTQIAATTMQATSPVV